MAKTCCFFGHRDTPSGIYPQILAAVEKLIAEQDVTEFHVGGYGNFDSMATNAVLEAKAQHPDVELLLITAYLPTGKSRHEGRGYDAIIYPEGLEFVPRRYAILRRNRIMVDTTDFIIAYVAAPCGGAAQALEYACSRKNPPVIINLHEAAQYE